MKLLVGLFDLGPYPEEEYRTETTILSELRSRRLPTGTLKIDTGRKIFGR